MVMILKDITVWWKLQDIKQRRENRLSHRFVQKRIDDFDSYIEFREPSFNFIAGTENSMYLIIYNDMLHHEIKSWQTRWW